MIRPIQLLLAAGALVALWLYLHRLRTRRRDAVLAALAFAAALAAIAVPGATTWVANQLGVGRGADLVSYLMWTLGAILLIALHGRVATLEAQLAELVRQHALDDAEPPAGPDDTPS